MNQLEKIIELYLKSDTNYALMIKGGWGQGKTYFYRNVLEKNIAKTPKYHDNSKNYKPILISLFGLKTVEQVETAIFLEIHSLLKNKFVKIAKSVWKSLIKGISEIKGLPDISESLSKIDIDKKEWITFEDLVICFDDLERISESFLIEELIGFINSLVENKNVKVLIIANDGRIDSKKYKLLKEKVVGNSIEYIPDKFITFDSIVNSKYKKASEEYSKFLFLNKNYILEIFSIGSSNFRTLIFALNYFKTVFSEIENNFTIKCPFFNEKNEILHDILRFTLSVSISYKEELKINFKEREGLNYSSSYQNREYSYQETRLKAMKNLDKNKEEKIIEKTFSENFINKYYSGKDYVFFESVYNFITGGSIFDFSLLYIQLEKTYHIQKNKLLPHYEVFNELSYTKVFNLSDIEYKQKTERLLKFSDKGLFNIENYCEIFHYATRFGNKFDYEVDDLVDRIIMGVEKGKENFKYVREIEYEINFRSKDEFPEQFKKIKDVLIEINKEILIRDNEKAALKMEKLCYENFDQFLEDMSNDENKYSEILSYFDPTRFYRFFNESSNNIKYRVNVFFRERYINNTLGSFKEEIVFFEELKENIKKNAQLHDSNPPSCFLFEKLNKNIDTAIERYSKSN